MRKRFSLLLAIFVLMAAACGSEDATDAASAEAAPDAGVVVSDLWSREPAAGQPNGVVYGTITNDTGEAVTVTGASVSVETNATELHEVIDDGGLMVMQERDGGFTIAPGESLVLEPGGAHVMLMGIDAATYPESLEVTFEFDTGESQSGLAEVRSISGDDDADHGDDHDHADRGDDHDHADHGDDEMESMSSDDDAMEPMDDDAASEGAAGAVSSGIELVLADGTIEAGPLHDLDTALRGGAEITGEQQALIAAYLEQLPSLEDLPVELIPALESAAEALASDNATAAADAIGAAHDIIHDMAHVHS